jgi:rod shape-determining protein MreD
VTSTGAAIARVGVLLLGVVVLQVSVLSQVRLLGAGADLMPLVVAAVGFFAGSIPGTATGFMAGLLLDLAVGGNVGASSLVLSGVGHLAGRVRETSDPSHELAPIAAGAVATAGYLAGMALVSLMLGFAADLSPLVLRDLLATVLVNSLLALPVFALVRRVLGRAVVPPPARSRLRRVIRQGPVGLRGLGLR